MSRQAQKNTLQVYGMFCFNPTGNYKTANDMQFDLSSCIYDTECDNEEPCLDYSGFDFYKELADNDLTDRFTSYLLGLDVIFDTDANIFDAIYEHLSNIDVSLGDNEDEYDYIANVDNPELNQKIISAYDRFSKIIKLENEKDNWIENSEGAEEYGNGKHTIEIYKVGEFTEEEMNMIEGFIVDNNGWYCYEGKYDDFYADNDKMAVENDKIHIFRFDIQHKPEYDEMSEGDLSNVLGSDCIIFVDESWDANYFELYQDGLELEDYTMEIYDETETVDASKGEENYNLDVEIKFNLGGTEITCISGGGGMSKDDYYEYLDLYEEHKERDSERE